MAPLTRTAHLFIALTVVLLGSLASVSQAFTIGTPQLATSRNLLVKRNIFNKKEDEDLSFIETRDMSRSEMEALNAENERVMNYELWGMTVFSLVLSVPMLYLVWVGFFSETAEIAGDLSDI